MCTLPLWLLLPLAIWIEDGGPIFFRQTRIGKEGKLFTALKFRSMRVVPDTEEIQATTNDPRITRIGKLMRLTALDELPQLINIVKQEMSFVGPRPERPCFVAELTEKVPFYGVRHSVQPGITGWAQVRCSYGASVEDAVRKLQFDLFYVKNHTFFLDLLILLETVRVVLFGEGAR